VHDDDDDDDADDDDRGVGLEGEFSRKRVRSVITVFSLPSGVQGYIVQYQRLASRDLVLDIVLCPSGPPQTPEMRGPILKDYHR